MLSASTLQPIAWNSTALWTRRHRPSIAMKVASKRPCGLLKLTSSNRLSWVQIWNCLWSGTTP